MMNESETLELKKSTSELKEAIISIVSILNKHQKGELYFGINNNGEVIGQNIGKKTIKDISKSISDNVYVFNFMEKMFPIMLMAVLMSVLEMKIRKLVFRNWNIAF